MEKYIINIINIMMLLLFFIAFVGQIWIHIEAAKIFFKGVPNLTFEHPEGTDVDFGWDITGKRLGNLLWTLWQPAHNLGLLVESIFGLNRPQFIMEIRRVTKITIPRMFKVLKYLLPLLTSGFTKFLLKFWFWFYTI